MHVRNTKAVKAASLVTPCMSIHVERSVERAEHLVADDGERNNDRDNHQHQLSFVRPLCEQNGQNFCKQPKRMSLLINFTQNDRMKGTY